MNLTPHQTEQVRLSILRYTASPLSLGLIASYLRAEGFAGLGREQVRAEIQYLLDKDLLRVAPKILSPEAALYRISAAGRDLLATQSGE